MQGNGKGKHEPFSSTKSSTRKDVNRFCLNSLHCSLCSAIDVFRPPSERKIAPTVVFDIFELHERTIFRVMCNRLAPTQSKEIANLLNSCSFSVAFAAASIRRREIKVKQQQKLRRIRLKSNRNWITISSMKFIARLLLRSESTIFLFLYLFLFFSFSFVYGKNVQWASKWNK